MNAVFVAAAIALASPTPNAATAGAPLREVVYHVSYTRHERLTQEGFPDAAAPQLAVQGADQTDQGTITVDVMAIANDSLAVKVTESWNQHPRPATFLGNIGPNGALHFGGQPTSEAADAILPIFGPEWMAGNPVDAGVKWSSTYSSTDAEIVTNYDVTSADAGFITIAEQQSVTVKAVRGLGGFMSGTIVYNPAKLVPISLKLERRSSHSSLDASDTETMVINVSRVSDSLDP